MINFNLMKNIVFLCFHEHKNTELNHFSYISKEANFRVLQFYPPYDESRPRDSEDGDKRDMDTLPLLDPQFPKLHLPLFGRSTTLYTL